MKRADSLFTGLMLALMVLSACAHDSDEKTESPSAPSMKSADSSTETVSKKNTQSDNGLHIDQATIKQDGQWVIVDSKVNNTSASSQPIKLDSFALMINHIALSPEENSVIPEQIPGETTATVKLKFKVNGIEGKQNVQLAYQPSDQAKMKQLFSLGSVIIENTVTVMAEAAQPTTDTVTSEASQPKTVTVSKKSVSIPKKSITLIKYKVGPVDVKIPKGWIKSLHHGGNFQGYDYVNPKDKNEKMSVIYSPCTGCGYPHGDPGTADPHPKKLIPQGHIKASFVFNGGLSAGYAYSLPGNPYAGNGVVKMVQGEGYAVVEILLPKSMKSVATEILNSAQFHGMY